MQLGLRRKRLCIKAISEVISPNEDDILNKIEITNTEKR